MEWMLRDYGVSLKKTKDPLPHRDDVVEFDVRTNTKELEKNWKLQGFPSDLQDKVKEVVTEFWYVFCEDGFRRPLWEFSFHIETCNHPPVFCKPPRYCPNESEVTRKLVVSMDEYGLVGEDDRTW